MFIFLSPLRGLVYNGGDGWGGHPTRGFTPPPNIYRTFGAFIKISSQQSNIHRTFGVFIKISSQQSNIHHTFGAFYPHSVIIINYKV